MDSLAMASPLGCVSRVKSLTWHPSRARGLSCLGKNENSINMSMELEEVKVEGHQIDHIEDSLSPAERGLHTSKSDIWKFFNDAQKNITFLNKKRLLAVEELKKVQRENKLLLERLEQLEARNPASVTEGTISEPTGPSSPCELLFRIDSMVLSGMIGTGEAYDLRKKVMDNEVAMRTAFCGIQHKTDIEVLAELRHFCERTMRNTFHILHICSEMDPIASSGSLASYVTGLSRALQRKGNLVEVILPKYASIDLATIKGLRKIDTQIDSYFGGHWHSNRVWTGVIDGIGVSLIEPLYHSYFNRENIYGYLDDFERFSYFSRASMDYIVKSGKQPDILHIHNWQTAIVGPLFWDIFVHQGLGGTRVLFTCLDLNSQCLEQPDKLALSGLDPPSLHRTDRLQDNNNMNLVNILKGGIVYSNKVIIMSSTQPRERIAQSFGYGLQSTLSIHKEKLLVAPYGFDGTEWDPSKDKFLPAKYSANDIEGKAVCKVALKHHLGLSTQSFAIVGYIYSEVSDANIDNLKVAIMHALRKGAQVVIMGPKLLLENATLQAVQDEHKDVNVRFIEDYDERLSHLILAGSDIILCSSFHDQIYQLLLKAIKYGSAPISINLGSAELSSHSEKHDFGSTTPSQYVVSAFADMSLSEALDEIKNEPSRWAQRIKDGMSRDFSWDAECCDVHLAAYKHIKNL